MCAFVLRLTTRSNEVLQRVHVRVAFDNAFERNDSRVLSFKLCLARVRTFLGRRLAFESRLETRSNVLRQKACVRVAFGYGFERSYEIPRFCLCVR